MGYSEDSKHIWTRFENLERNLDEKVASLEAQLHIKSEQLSQLEHFLEHDADVTTKNLASASRQASTYKNRIIQSEKEASQKKIKIDQIVAKLESEFGESEVMYEKIERNLKSSNDNLRDLTDSLTILDRKILSVDTIINQANQSLENSKQIESTVIQLESKISQLEEMDSKSKALYQNFTKRKNDIDEFYYKYMGQEGDVGISGAIKKEAKELMDDYEILRQKLVELEEKTEEKTKAFLAISEKRAEQFFTESNSEKAEVLKEINELLPSALTAGLSSAYEVKVDKEVAFQSKMDGTFRWAIVALILVSTLPFFISIMIDGGNFDFKSVLNSALKYLPLIAPMYLPILWVAYSTNKRINLSKRLIEEYTHKGVLNKTFKGLSDQIDAIRDTDLTEDLRSKLLFNLLSASAENPGKLISDYNSSDHPLMDALDKSAKLANSIDVLSRIPGFSKMVTKLDKKSKDILATQEHRVGAVLGESEENKSEKQA